MASAELDLYDRGVVLWVRLDDAEGHEQQKERPGIVVSRRAMTAGHVLTIVPMTTQLRPNVPYEVEMAPEETGLPVTSAAMTQQIRTITKARIVRKAGRVTADAMARLDEMLVEVLDLG